MKLKEAPELKGKKFKEYYDNQVPPRENSISLALAVYPEHCKNDNRISSKDEEAYIKGISDTINELDIMMAENSVIILSGFWGDKELPNEVNAVWKSVMSAIKTTDYSIGDVIVWKKGFKTKNNRDNRLDTICEPIFVLSRKSEYRTYHLNVNVQTVRGNAVYHTPIYNLITTTGKDVEEDYKQLKEYLLRMYCPDNGIIYNMFEEDLIVQDK